MQLLHRQLSLTSGEQISAGKAPAQNAAGDNNSHWRCFRAPSAAVPCSKRDDLHHRPTWFFDVSTGACRVNPVSTCGITIDVGNNFDALEDCIRTCLPG